MEGQNFVELQGYISYPKLSYTQAGKPRFQARLVIPVTYTNRDGETVSTNNYVPVTAWSTYADAMSELPDGAPVKVQGNLNIRNYDGRCQACDSPLKKKWAEVVVRNFVELVEEDVVEDQVV